MGSKSRVLFCFWCIAPRFRFEMVSRKTVNGHWVLFCDEECEDSCRVAAEKRAALREPSHLLDYDGRGYISNAVLKRVMFGSDFDGDR